MMLLALITGKSLYFLIDHGTTGQDKVKEKIS